MTALLPETVCDLMARLTEEEKRWAGEKWKRQVVRNLASSTDVLAGIILAAWNGVRETLELEGFEGQWLGRQCKQLLDGIDWILPAYERFVAQGQESGLTSEDARLQDLEAKLPALREARPRIAEVFGLTMQPAKPIDGEMLAASRTAFERGEFVIADEGYLTRLRAGQPF
jgi:hypothetical protein